MYDKSLRYKVTYSDSSSFNVGDIVRPIKQTAKGVLIGHNYRKSFYFDRIDDIEMQTMSAIDGRLLVKIERIK